MTQLHEREQVGLNPPPLMITTGGNRAFRQV